MSALDELKRTALPRGQSAAWMVVLLVVTGLVWAHYAEFDEVATAAGEVVPEGQVKVIQHLEGGIIAAIDIAEGQAVKAGDRLVQLDLGTVAPGRDEILVQIDGLTLRRARLQAEASGQPFEPPAALKERYPDLARTETDAYDGRARQQASTLSVLKSQTRQRELEVRELESRQRASAANLRLAEQRFGMSKDLLAQDLVPKMEHLKLAAELEGLQGTLGQLAEAIPRARGALAEAVEREREEALKFRRTAVEELGQVELSLARQREILAKAADQVRRTEVRSPIDGVVKRLRFNTIGGVVRPGDPIMEIVPSQDQLVIEARLNPTDVGYVRAGQPAVVKISTYEFTRYGGLDGMVTAVAPDSTVDRDKGTYFRLIVETDKGYLGDAPGQFPISAGMQAIVDVHTGTKSVLRYLITPVLKLRHEAFRER
ncbi:MAG: HlyD family type I secretion periplasmic adaptor subunit [Rhodospirillales bacterium]